MPFYIQRKVNPRNITTIEEFHCAKQAYRKAAEYNLNNPEALHYVSRTPCKSWESSG